MTSQNTALPRIESQFAGSGFGYVGQELYATGVALGAETVQRFDLKEGDQAMVWGLLSQPTRGERTQGVIDALEKAGLQVDYLEIDDATNADPATGTPTLADRPHSQPAAVGPDDPTVSAPPRLGGADSLAGLAVPRVAPRYKILIAPVYPLRSAPAPAFHPSARCRTPATGHAAG